MTAKNSQVTWHDGRVTPEDRRRLFRQRPVTIWLTGLSASGKSTLAYELEHLEVFLDAPLEVCEARDPKGLYRKARAGEVSEFTGISAPYERPEHPDMVLRTDLLDASQAAAEVMARLEAEFFIN